MSKNRKIIRQLSWVVVLIWMVVIYIFSAQPAYDSDNLSKGITKQVVKTIEKVAPKREISIDLAEHMIRKNAHFFNYLILAILIVNAFRQKNQEISISIVLGICVLYAISDELHQLFVPGRGAMAKDVFIDSSGAILGIILYLLVFKLIKKDSLLIKP